MAVRNRFVRSATGESRADKRGFIGEDVHAIYAELARGGVGLIITGHMYVHQAHKCSPRQTGIWCDEQVTGLRGLARASQTNGARVVAQINYATRKPEDLTADDIRETADAFVAAAGRAREAGYDGVQIHAAHGYLLSCFLTPSENTRTDRHGGDASGRRRLLVEITERVRDVIGPDLALLCKLGAVDGRDDSLPLAESVATAAALEAAGVDAVEVSSTLSGPRAQPAAEGIDSVAKEAYFRSQARAIRDAVSIPVILVGGLRSLVVMEEAVHGGSCDMVSMSRPFIREPGLVNAFSGGAADRAACISCNKCYDPHGFHCVFA
jgi:2,4-dienoyl-CoA reductase-like NADH-dependent reductase (Old Yellow Enzyme family)